MLKWRHLMCERRAEGVRKDKRVPIQLSPLTEEATDAFQFMPKNILIFCEQFNDLKYIV